MDAAEAVSRHAGLVHHIAREVGRRHAGRGMDDDDMVQEGFVALIKVAPKFDDSRGVPFAGYAGTEIRWAIWKWRDRWKDFNGLPVDENGKAMEPPDRVGHDPDARDEVEARLKLLPERWQEIVRLRYGLEDGREHSTVEIAEQMGVTHQAVSALLAKALERMRDVGHVAKASPVYGNKIIAGHRSNAPAIIGGRSDSNS